MAEVSFNSYTAHLGESAGKIAEHLSDGKIISPHSALIRSCPAGLGLTRLMGLLRDQCVMWLG